MKNILLVINRLALCFLLLSVFLGQIDLAPQTLTPLGKTTDTRFGWYMPGYLDGLAVQFFTVCHDLKFATGSGEIYNNTIGLAFFRDKKLIKTRILNFERFSNYSISTSFDYDAVIFYNADNQPDAVYGQTIRCKSGY